jgi:DNA-binding response OmpR family regulator
MAKKILVIEDEPKLATQLVDTLRNDGYTVSLADDGEQAWEKARTEKPDLFVLDMMLPKLDGLSLCRMIRNETSLSTTPIIIITARGGEMDKIIGLESGADDYLVKPFGIGEFLARVRAVLRRPSSTATLQQDEIVISDIRLNLTSRRLFKGEDEKKLSNKEFDLLAELMRNKNAVLSRDLLLAKVWGYDYFVDKRTVDVHVRWLREKIEDDASNPRRIVTVRGVGYRFEG